jgi:hypothetical protein
MRICSLSEKESLTRSGELQNFALLKGPIELWSNDYPLYLLEQSVTCQLSAKTIL